MEDGRHGRAGAVPLQPVQRRLREGRRGTNLQTKRTLRRACIVNVIDKSMKKVFSEAYSEMRSGGGGGKGLFQASPKL